MEVPFGEKEELEVETWNTTEYDIAEEEEERLLEENEISVEGHFEGDANFSDNEFEIHETEEDILDLGLNEETEFEEVRSSCLETSSESHKPQSHSSSGSSSHIETPLNTPINNQSTLLNSSNGNIKSGPQRNIVRNFLPKRQTYYPIPVQLRSAPSPRVGPPFFHSVRPHCDRPLIGRPPSVPHHLGSRGGLIRQPEPVFIKEFAHVPRPQEFQRQYLLNHQPPPIDFERNSLGMNRFFVNPHYRGTVSVQNNCANRVSAMSDARNGLPLPESSLTRNPFPNRHHAIHPQVDPNLMNSRPTTLAPMRYVSPLQSRASKMLPRLNEFVDDIGAPCFKMGSPQSLMDMVLPTPFGESRLPSRTQRVRFHSYETYTPTQDSFQQVRFFSPPPTGSKRPSTSEISATPLKQLRLEPSGNLQVLRTFPPPLASQSLTSTSSNIINSLPRGIQSFNPRPQRPTTVQSQRFPVKAAEKMFTKPNITQNRLIKPNVSDLPTSQPLTTRSQSPLQSTASSAVLENPVNSAETNPEMIEYLEKMEEQRKKREEVLRIKEERRRQKLALTNEPDVKVNRGFDYDPVHCSASLTGNPFNVKVKPREPDTAFLVGDINASSSSCQPKAIPSLASKPPATIRKTVLVKPTPTSTAVATKNIPQATVGINRRYKIIIVKNKSGKILEKRRVPIDEPVVAGPRNTPNHTSPSSTSVGEFTSHVSSSVSIENLDSNTTEDYVWKLCQMFGSVQEVYPKLQEGKAIVRFTSASGANNFITNHKTPGLCARFL